MRSSNLKITEIGPFKSAIDSYTMENGTEYPVLYLRESFHPRRNYDWMGWKANR